MTKTPISDAIGILLLTHGDLGEHLMKSISMIYGKTKNVATLPLFEGVNLEEYINDIVKICETFPKGVLVFVDLYGGTPGNQLIKLLHEKKLDKEKIWAISGINLSMLLEALVQRDLLDTNELVEEVLRAGQEGIVYINKLIQDRE